MGPFHILLDKMGLDQMGLDNNKTTVFHLAIPWEVSRLLWHGATGRWWQSPSVRL